MNRSAALVVGITLGLMSAAACGSNSGVVDGPVLSVGEDPRSVELARTTGILELDPATGCLFINGEGSSSAVIWPSGTTWRADPPGVVLKRGSMLPVGAEIQVGGGGATPADLEQRAAADLQESAERCTDAGAGLFIVQTVVDEPSG